MSAAVAAAAAAVLLQVAALQAVMALPEEEASAQLIIERCATLLAGHAGYSLSACQPKRCSRSAVLSHCHWQLWSATWSQRAAHAPTVLRETAGFVGQL
jgi:hypothetical protein